MSYKKAQTRIVLINGKVYYPIFYFGLCHPVCPVFTSKEWEDILVSSGIDTNNQKEVEKFGTIFNNAISRLMPKEDINWKYKNEGEYFEHYQNSDEWKNLNININIFFNKR